MRCLPWGTTFGGQELQLEVQSSLSGAQTGSPEHRDSPRGSNQAPGVQAKRRVPNQALGDQSKPQGTTSSARGPHQAPGVQIKHQGSKPSAGYQIKPQATKASRRGPHQAPGDHIKHQGCKSSTKDVLSVAQQLADKCQVCVISNAWYVAASPMGALNSENVLFLAFRCTK